jgi:peptidoglycan hydrolase-like protein with peptidoglycan-binding domain
MIYSLTWLPLVLEGAGLKVALVDGWASRGRGDMGPVVGAMCHHTAGPSLGNMPSLRTLIEGRGDLPGPLAQLGLGRDGTYYVIAAGRCNHAGPGEWRGLTTGNSSFIGIEAENAGTPGDFPWPDVQMNCYRRGVAAILQHIGHGPEFCAGHREYALPKGRKNDPQFDMNAFRAEVAAIMSGSAPPPVLIPSVEPAGGGRPTLRRGAFGELVRAVQARCAVEADGAFGALTEAAVRRFQRDHGLVPDGIVGPKTWAALDAMGNLKPDLMPDSHAA